MIQIPFVDRIPTANEVERIRLILSTYQDGTGMLVADGKSLPGWRDFERAVAVALGGVAQESKAVFDVVLHAETPQVRPLYGISCKMRRELDRIQRDGRATIEVSNAAGEFWSSMERHGVSKTNFAAMATQAGAALINVVNSWYQIASIKNGGRFDIESSSYLVLLWNTVPEYQLFQFPLTLYDAAELKWSVPAKRGHPTVEGRRLCGFDGIGYAVEWYGNSGGQLKLYPKISSSIWRSDRFRLEPIPDRIRGVSTKAGEYFPKKWRAALT